MYFHTHIYMSAAHTAASIRPVLIQSKMLGKIQAAETSLVIIFKMIHLSQGTISSVQRFLCYTHINNSEKDF
jgi:hypothetical protein